MEKKRQRHMKAVDQMNEEARKLTEAPKMSAASRRILENRQKRKEERPESKNQQDQPREESKEGIRVSRIPRLTQSATRPAQTTSVGPTAKAKQSQGMQEI